MKTMDITMVKLVLLTDDDQVLKTWTDKESNFIRRTARELVMYEINSEIIKYKARMLYEETKDPGSSSNL